jgi:hypothetical protein
MSGIPDQRSYSANRRGKTSKRIFASKKNDLKSDKFHQLNPEEYLDSGSSKTYQSDSLLTTVHFNLPEFIHFQSDRLVSPSQLTSYRSYDRLRSPSTVSSSKFKRQSMISQTTTNTASRLPSKRLSRSRHSYDATIYHEKQRQQQKHPMRLIGNKIDSVSCFKEVSRLVIFFFGLFIQVKDT